MTATVSVALAAFTRAGVGFSVAPRDVGGDAGGDAGAGADERNLIWEADHHPSDIQARWITAHKAELIRELTSVRIDFETVSPLDLEEVGTAVYVAHPGTRVLLLSWCVGAGEVSVWWPGEPIPAAIPAALDAGGILVSHGPFDRIIWAAKLVPLGWPAMPIERWSDTSARCRAYRAPAGLEKAALRLDLAYRKDRTGKALIRRASQAAKGEAPPLTPEELDAFAKYAVTDTETMRELDRLLPELSGTEHAVYQLDARINERGLPIDISLVRRLHEVLEPENRRLVEQMNKLCGLNPTQTTKLRAWLGQNTANPPDDMQAETLERWLDTNTSGDLPRDVVRTRVEFANASGEKLRKLLASTSADGRARGCFVWHGAHTGRWSGRGFQPQNLPRLPDKFDFDATLAGLLREGGPVSDDGLSVKARIALCIRGLIKAPDGQELVVADFAQIESRVLCWLAGQENMLGIYRKGGDPYMATAQALGSDSRQFGKLLVLSAGFGAGGNKLYQVAPSYRVQLTAPEAALAIARWRQANPRIVAFWDTLHEAMREAVEGPSGHEHVVALAAGSCRLTVWRNNDDDTLRIRLPSGRHLIYHQPRIVPDEEFDWRFNLVYQQAGPGDWLEKQSWRGLVTENVVQAVAYDLMADAMLRMDADGIELIGTVHDEVIALALEAQADAVLAEMLRVMSTPPAWASDLPLAAEGYHAVRYVKPRAPSVPKLPVNPFIAAAAQHPHWDVNQLAAHFGVPVLRIERALKGVR